MSDETISRKEVFKKALILMLAHHPPEQYDHCLMVGIGNHKIPLCARCTGIYTGFALSYILFTFLGILIKPDLFWLTIGFGLGLTTIIEWVSQRLTPRVTNNKLRTGTGLLSGVGLTIVSLMRNLLVLYITLFIILGAFLIVILHERKQYRHEVTVLRL